MKKVLSITLSLFIGVVFLFSAYSKIINIEPFEWTIAETGWFSFKMANILARLILISEIFVGILFIAQLGLKKFTYGFGAILLMLFNAYLLYILFQYGNNGNCGCFGEMLKMSPLNAYWKNLIIVFLIYLLSRFYNGLNIKKCSLWINIIVAFSLITVVIYEPPFFIYKLEKEKVENSYLTLGNLEFENGSSFNYQRGKYVISLFSTSCPFCKKAARKIHSMYKSHSEIPFVNIIYGAKEEKRTRDFFTESISEDVPYILSKDKEMFGRVTGHKLPAIFFVENGIITKSENYFDLDDKTILNWLKQ